MPGASGTFGSAYGVGLATSIGLPCPVAAPLPRKWRLASAIQLPCLAGRLLSRMLRLVSPIWLPCLAASSAVPGGSGVGQSLSAPMPVGHPLSTAESCKDDEEDVRLPIKKGPLWLLLLLIRSLWLLGNPAVSVSSHLLAQMEKVCGSMADIASWTDQVLATWAGAVLNKKQNVLEFLLALAKANKNKDILRPAEELHCRLLMLWRQAVVDSLPCTFSDRENEQLLSSPFSDVLFDPAVVAMVQEEEHLAPQQCALSSVVWGLASSFWGSFSGPQGSKIKVQTRRGAFRSSSLSALVPRPSATGGSFGVDPMAENFLEDRAPSVSLWRSLLGHLASLERLVPGGQIP
ncbi:hypothetical protein E2C01_062142 [Portunus trituberculatus]|uniref:Uncharacterized protein n=1 Tax=Portunus trituberculatus TaxID=210409 RepID=A0A5B7HEB2_PORTR|nr:hypothetical protein [Portunus trituberculatus]